MVILVCVLAAYFQLYTCCWSLQNAVPKITVPSGGYTDFTWDSFTLSTTAENFAPSPNEEFSRCDNTKGHYTRTLFLSTACPRFAIFSGIAVVEERHTLSNVSVLERNAGRCIENLHRTDTKDNRRGTKRRNEASAEHVDTGYVLAPNAHGEQILMTIPRSRLHVYVCTRNLILAS